MWTNNNCIFVICDQKCMQTGSTKFKINEKCKMHLAGKGRSHNLHLSYLHRNISFLVFSLEIMCLPSKKTSSLLFSYRSISVHMKCTFILKELNAVSSSAGVVTITAAVLLHGRHFTPLIDDLVNLIPGQSIMII